MFLRFFFITKLSGCLTTLQDITITFRVEKPENYAENRENTSNDLLVDCVNLSLICDSVPGSALNSVRGSWYQCDLTFASFRGLLRGYIRSSKTLS